MKWPFMTKAAHTAIVSQYEQQIAYLRSELSFTRTDRLRAETSRDHAVKQSLDVLTANPAVSSAPAKKKEPKSLLEELTVETPKTLDLADIAIEDIHQITLLALREMPPGKRSASLLTSKIDSVKNQILIAKAVRKQRSREVGTIEAPEVPTSVMEKIDAAMLQGKAQASAGVN